MKITAKTRKSINSILQDNFGKRYFDSIPLDEMFGVLGIHGVVVIQEDGTPWSGFLCGRDGRAEIELSIEGEIVENSIFLLQWHKMESGRYEINSYVS